MKIKCFDIAIFVSLFLCVLSVLAFENKCENIRESVLRLHIIADSDEESAQKLKLQIRDAVLQKSGELFSFDDDLQSAKQKAQSSIEEIEKIAKQVIKQQGENYTVNAYIGKSYFPTRVYDENITFPAGYYDALKIVIGKGQGKNWWCVMFPSICLGAAVKREELLESVLGEDGMRIVESDPKYEVRFWIVEKYYEIKEKLSEEG